MRPEQLLPLFPRSWRERYGDEFLATAGDERLRLRQVIDIAAGAIDAWVSPSVRRATRAARPQPAQGENLMLQRMVACCGSTEQELSKRDAWIGAAVLIGCTILFSFLGIAAKRNGFEMMGEGLLGIAFPGSVLLAMPFTYLKGRPWRAQVVLVGLPLLFLVLIALLASLI